MPIQLGNVAPATQLVFAFNTHKADGTPWTLDGTPTVRVRWYGGEDPQYSDSAAVLTVNSGSITGYHVVEVDTTGIAAGLDCSIYLTAGTVDGVSVVGTVLALFSVSNRVPTAAQAANLDAAVSTRLATTGYTVPPTAAANADAVWDEATSGHTGTGSFGKLIGTTWAAIWQGITSLAQTIRDAMMLAPTSGTPAAGSIDKHLDDVQAKTDHLAAGKITLVNALLEQGGRHLVLHRGDDHTLATRRELEWTDDAESWPDLTNATVVLRIKSKDAADSDDPEAEWECEVVDAGEDVQTVRCEPTHDDTAGLTTGTRCSDFEIEATLDDVDSSVVTLIAGEATVVADLGDIEAP